MLQGPPPDTSPRLSVIYIYIYVCNIYILQTNEERCLAVVPAFNAICENYTAGFVAIMEQVLPLKTLGRFFRAFRQVRSSDYDNMFSSDYDNMFSSYVFTCRNALKMPPSTCGHSVLCPHMQ